MYNIRGTYSPDMNTKMLLARIDSTTASSAANAFISYVKKRAKEDGRKFAKNYSLRKDGQKDDLLTIFVIGSPTMKAVSLYLTRKGDFQNGETIGKIVLPAKAKKKGAK